MQDAGHCFALDTDDGWTGAMRDEWCAAPARLALLPSAAQLTGTILIATLHVLVGAIHAALLMALETAVILFGFVAIGYAVRGIMLGTAEMQSKAVELVSSACTLHTPIILAAICNFLLCAVVATHTLKSSTAVDRMAATPNRVHSSNQTYHNPRKGFGKALCQSSNGEVHCYRCMRNMLA